MEPLKLIPGKPMIIRTGAVTKVLVTYKLEFNGIEKKLECIGTSTLMHSDYDDPKLGIMIAQSKCHKMALKLAITELKKIHGLIKKRSDYYTEKIDQYEEALSKELLHIEDLKMIQNG